MTVFTVHKQAVFAVKPVQHFIKLESHLPQDILPVSHECGLRESGKCRIILKNKITISLIFLITLWEYHLPHSPIGRTGLIEVKKAAVGDDALVTVTALSQPVVEPHQWVYA